MKKTLLAMALLSTLGVWAAPLTTPEAGKAYSIQNATGLYMTAEGTTLKLHELDAKVPQQRFEFVPVAETSGVYNIKMSNGLYVGTDGGYSVAYKENAADANAQYKIVVSTADPESVLLTSVGTGKSLGCDGSEDGATVFTDKNDSKDTFRWKIALAPEPVSISAPEALKYYRIRHVSGLYLTDTGYKTLINNKVEDNNSQIVQFVPVEGAEGVYNIRRAATGMFLGSDNKWTAYPVSRNIPLSQYKVAPSEADNHYVTLQNMGMAATKSYLGTDDVVDGSGVYTDKTGKDAAKHLWFIEEADLYVAPLNPADYADRTNLVKNGDFEAAGYEQAQKDGQMTLSTLPEWTLVQTGWGGAVAVNENGENHYVACQGYAGNDWGLDIAVEQEIAVAPGREHALFFDYMLGNGGRCSWGYSVIDKNNTPEDNKDDVVLATYTSETAMAEWTPYAAAFTPTSDKVTLRLFLNNPKKDQWRENKTAYFDNVRVYDIAPVDFYADHQLAEGDVRANAYDGYRLVFAQEFSTAGTPDHDVWNFEKGFKRNHEEQYYDSDKNCYIQDGVLVIEGRYVKDQKIKNPDYNKYSKDRWPGNIGEYLTWTSGSMQTKGGWNDGYTWQYGIYEVRAKVPQYVGSWPAIWSTGKQYGWPKGGEIDIMEYYRNCIHANVCWGDNQWESRTVHDNVLGEGWGDEFHTWRMVWDYNHMELWCDDMLVNNIDLDKTVNPEFVDDPNNENDKPADWNGVNPFRQVRQMLWLNLALGGDNGGSLANTPRPLYYQIDYARVYQKIGTDGKASYLVDDEISEPTFSIKDGETAGIDNVSVEMPAATTGVYNLQGIRVADSLDEIPAHTGRQVYIVTGEGRSQKVIR